MNYKGYHTVEKYGCDGCAFSSEGCSCPTDFPGDCSGDEYFIWVKDTPATMTLSVQFDREAFEKDIIKSIADIDFSKYFKFVGV